MSSTSHKNWVVRLEEITQLVEAHGALIRYKKAKDALERGGADIRKVAMVIDVLVSDLGQGKPPEVRALNSAAIALLSAHLQGFITELYEEACNALLHNHVQDTSAIVSTAQTRGNPNEQNIRRLFGSIGFTNILEKVSWKRMSNESLRKKLREFNELRNRIVHGKSEAVTKAQVTNYLNVWTNLAKHLDNAVHDEIQRITGKVPWKKI